MKMVFVAGVCTLALAGCSGALGGMSGDFVGSPHGYSGSLVTPRGTRVIATPTIDGNLDAMGSRKMSPDGTILETDMYSTFSNGVLSATGPAAIIAACAFAPMAPQCNMPGAQ